MELSMNPIDILALYKAEVEKRKSHRRGGYLPANSVFGGWDDLKRAEWDEFFRWLKKDPSAFVGVDRINAKLSTLHCANVIRRFFDDRYQNVPDDLWEKLVDEARKVRKKRLEGEKNGT